MLDQQDDPQERLQGLMKTDPDPRVRVPRACAAPAAGGAAHDGVAGKGGLACRLACRLMHQR
jgi:hypothetical protein